MQVAELADSADFVDGLDLMVMGPEAGAAGLEGKDDLPQQGGGAHAAPKDPSELKQFSDALDEKAKAAAKVEATQQETPTAQPLPGEEKIVRMLHDALEYGDVSLRTGLGQRFKQWLDKYPAQQADYERLNGESQSTKKKAAFRIAWAKQQMASRTVVTKTKKQCLIEEFGEQGTYMSLERLIIQEGGVSCDVAVDRARRYALECIRRGPPFLAWNSWKGVTELLVFERVRNSMSKNSYTLERSAVT